MDTLLAKLSAQQAALEEQKNFVGRPESATDSANQTNVTKNARLRAQSSKVRETNSGASVNGGEDHPPMSVTEVERLKQELTAAKDRITKQEQELTHTRAIHNVLEQNSSGMKTENIDKTVNYRSGGGFSHDDTKSDTSDTIPGSMSLNRGASIWDNGLSATNPNGNINPGANIWAQGSRPPWMNRPSAPSLPPLMVPPQQSVRAYSGSSSPVFGNMPQCFGDVNQYQYGAGLRRYNNQSSRSGSSFNPTRSSCWSSYGSSGEMSPITNISPASYQPMGLFPAPHGYHPRPIGTPLSPTAAEFTSANGNGPWNTTVS